MFPEPRFLDLESELYPTLTLSKELVIDNEEDGLHLRLLERLPYDSYQRTIELSEPLTHALRTRTPRPIQTTPSKQN